MMSSDHASILERFGYGVGQGWGEVERVHCSTKTASRSVA